MPGKLSIVATPIGNLEDMSERAKRILKESDLIACEDTRVTGKLLQRYNLTEKRLFSLHQHTKPERLRSLIRDMQHGKRVSYVSDAGTPNVNDPGGKLVQMAYETGIETEVIPGPSALTAGIMACGFPMERFTYIGFVPRKKHRASILRDISKRNDPTVLFESTHRIIRTLEELLRFIDANRLIYVGRELTKRHETHIRGTLPKILEQLRHGSTKGEFVVIVGPKS